MICTYLYLQQGWKGVIIERESPVEAEGLEVYECKTFFTIKPGRTWILPKVNIRTGFVSVCTYSS
jgi:hypothetical protein